LTFKENEFKAKMLHQLLTYIPVIYESSALVFFGVFWFQFDIFSDQTPSILK